MTPPTPVPPSRSGAGRPAASRSMQEDLLRELRSAAPMPATPATTGATAAAAVRARQDATARPEESPATTLEVRVTPQRWSPPRITGLRGGAGVSAALGPVRLSLRMPGR